MNKFLPGLYFLIFFLAFNTRLCAQQFSQYNTGTLYDSFENPSQKTFIPDSSRKVGFNIFIPNFNLDFTLAGNAQSGLKNRVFLNAYDPTLLTIGKKNYNYVKANLNAYFFTLKIYTNLNNNAEIGFFGQSKAEARGVFSDETVQILDDSNVFGDSQSNLFNIRYNYQVYHQIGVSYRQDIDKQVSFGFKVGALFGVVANRVNVFKSNITYDRPNDKAFISAAGNYRASFEPGEFAIHDLIPSTRNPGASVSLGVGYLSDNNYKFQFNLKDLGFIHWNKQSLVGNFDNTGVIDSLSDDGLEGRVVRTAQQLVQSNSATQSFTTHTNALFETSISKSYWLNDDVVKYTPTLILSKELFYRDFSAALVNHFQHNNLVATLTTSYDDMHDLNLGGQLMVKSPNMELFIGSDRLGQTIGLAREALGTSMGTDLRNNRYSGANIYMGFSIKIGSVIEHPMNASRIPMGETRSFFKRLWQRITKKID